MLTKLLKYEWKTTARVLLPIGGGVLGFTLITSLVNHLLNGYEAWPQVAVWLQDLLNVRRFWHGSLYWEPVFS